MIRILNSFLFKQVPAKLLFIVLLNSCLAFSQSNTKTSTNHDDALVDVFVEPYYTVTRKDCKLDSNLKEGTTVYRIYVRLKEGYELQAVYGSENHPLSIQTTTTFYNSNTHNSTFGRKVPDTLINNGTTLFDSWISIGSATNSHVGVPLEQDTNGSIIKNKQLKKADGLSIGTTQNTIIYKLDVSCLIKNGLSEISTNNGLWALPTGCKTSVNNNILIAQLSTDGTLSFKINVQVAAPNGDIIQFTAHEALAEKEIQSNKLIYNP